MTQPIRVLELRSVWGTGGGPDKTILAGARLADPARYAVTVCYIRDARDPIFSIDTRARSLGLDYVEVTEQHSLDYRIWGQLVRVIRDRNIDIVHAHDHKTDALTWALCRRLAMIPLSTAHGFSGYTRREGIYYAIEKRILARFPRVIAVSGPIKAELVRTGCRPERITVINNGIDHVAFRRDTGARDQTRQALALQPGQVAIAGVGRLELEKRFDVLLEAFSGVVRNCPTAVLFLAGEGSLRERLQRLSVALGIAPAVRFLGQRHDLIALHSAFDLFVQSSEREGTPNAVLEAMALETPLVATNVGGTSELVTDGVHGLLVPRNNAAALQSAIERSLGDWASTRQRAAAARQRIERDLSFAQRMHKVEGIYDELMVTHGKVQNR